MQNQACQLALVEMVESGIVLPESAIELAKFFMELATHRVHPSLNCVETRLEPIKVIPVEQNARDDYQHRYADCKYFVHWFHIDLLPPEHAGKP